MTKQPDAGQVAVSPSARRPVGAQVVGAGFEGDRGDAGAVGGQPGDADQREVALVPAQAAVVGQVEVVNFLAGQDRAEHRRVLAQRVEERGGAAPLRAYDQEAGQHPRPLGRSAGSDQAPVRDPPGQPFPFGLLRIRNNGLAHARGQLDGVASRA